MHSSPDDILFHPIKLVVVLMLRSKLTPNRAGFLFVSKSYVRSIDAELRCSQQRQSPKVRERNINTNKCMGCDKQSCDHFKYSKREMGGLVEVLQTRDLWSHLSQLCDWLLCRGG